MKKTIIGVIAMMLMASVAQAQSVPEQPTTSVAGESGYPNKEVPNTPDGDLSTPNNSVLPAAPIAITASGEMTVDHIKQMERAIKDAQVVPVAPLTTYDAHKLHLGFGMDLGAPSGVAIGFVAHPRLDWMSLEAAFTYLTAPGGRFSMKLDPFAVSPRLPIGLFGDVQLGFMAREDLPFRSQKLPSIGDDYANFLLGLRLGRVNGFHWFFEAGETALHANTDNFQRVVGSLSKGLVIGNPTANLYAPALSTGFAVVWP
jgi:hypothetical protein